MYLKRLSFLLAAILLPSALAVRASGTPTTIQNPGGGTIFFGPLSGQLTPVAALNQIMKQVETKYGDRPQLGPMVQNQAGTIWEGFFTVNNKSGDGAAMTGMVIVYAPQTGTAGGAVLIDTTARFLQTVDSMFQGLVQAITGASQPTANAPQSSASAAPAASGPAQTLTPYLFPDGSGSMGLPPGWTVARAQLGDVTAQGPNGERLRFGLEIPALNRSGTASGNFVAVPYNSDPATLFTQVNAQLAQKMRAQAPTITIANTQSLPLQGGKSFMVYGQVDAHDGRGPQALVAQMIVMPPQAAGAYQMTVFEITAPPQVMVNDAATIAEIYPNYSRNAKYINAVANAQIQEGLMQEQQFLGTVAQDMDSSDRMTAGMSNLLRNQTVIRDTQTGAHITTTDGLANLLTQSNPNRFETVPESQYISGIDY